MARKTPPKVTAPPRPLEERLDLLARQSLTALLRVKAGLEVITCLTGATRVTLTARLQAPERMSDFLLATEALLHAEARGAWSIDISRRYLLHEGVLKSAFRLILSWPPRDAAARVPGSEEDAIVAHVEESLLGFVEALQGVPTRAVELTSYSLGPAATAGRHRTVATSGSPASVALIGGRG